MQEEWHCNKRKCTFILLPRNLLLLDLDIGDNNQPSIAVALPLHFPTPLHCCCAVNCHCPCAVHCRCCCGIAVVPSIAIVVDPSIAVAAAPSITVIAIALPLCLHPLALPLPLSLLSSLSLLPPPPLPAFADPFVGWLLWCCPPSAFVIAFCHATH